MTGSQMGTLERFALAARTDWAQRHGCIHSVGGYGLPPFWGWRKRAGASVNQARSFTQGPLTVPGGLWLTRKRRFPNARRCFPVQLVMSVAAVIREIAGKRDFKEVVPCPSDLLQSNHACSRKWPLICLLVICGEPEVDELFSSLKRAPI